MTREEIKNIPELVDFILDRCIEVDSRIKVHKRLEEVCNLAIQALEQEPILDRIRAEIDEEYDRVHPYDISCAEGLEMALNIIDKYKAESEEK